MNCKKNSKMGFATSVHLVSSHDRRQIRRSVVSEAWCVYLEGSKDYSDDGSVLTAGGTKKIVEECGSSLPMNHVPWHVERLTVAPTRS